MYGKWLLHHVFQNYTLAEAPTIGIYRVSCFTAGEYTISIKERPQIKCQDFSISTTKTDLT